MNLDRTLSHCPPRPRRWALFAAAGLTLAGACSVDSSGLREPPGIDGGGLTHQTGSGGAIATGTGGIVGGGTGSAGSAVSASGGAGVASGGRTASGGGVVSTGGGGGASANGTGGLNITPGTGTGGAAIAGRGGTSTANGSGGAKASGGMNGITGSGGVTGSGGAGSLGGSPASSAGHGGDRGGPGGASPLPCGPLTCADGCCEGNTCLTTRTDARCGKGGATCAACGKCFRCATAGACEVDPSSTWRIVCSSAVLSATQANGEDWDPTPGAGSGPGSGMGSGMGSGPGAGPGSGGEASGLPDPICHLALGQGEADPSTSVLMNTLTPKWNETLTPSPTSLTAARLMSQASPWSITVSDDDEPMASALICRVTPELTSADFAATDVTFPSTQSCTSLSIRLVCVGG